VVWIVKFEFLPSFIFWHVKEIGTTWLLLGLNPHCVERFREYWYSVKGRGSRCFGEKEIKLECW